VILPRKLLKSQVVLMEMPFKPIHGTGPKSVLPKVMQIRIRLSCLDNLESVLQAGVIPRGAYLLIKQNR